MNKHHKDVRISTRELVYLRNTRFLSRELRQFIETAATSGDHEYELSIPPGVAEQFRSAFTNHLAKVGFDSSYELTGEGKLLEGLIDRFHTQ